MEETNMRVMVIVKANQESESGVLPSRELLTEMGKFNEELVKAGVMLAGEGLHSSAKGVRVKFGGGKSTVTDGPFTETKELIAGFWLWQVKSIEEAIEWIRRSPFQKGNEEIERPAEAERIFATLADGGQVTMPVQETFWAHRFGMVTDRFGTPWMVNCAKPLGAVTAAARKSA